MKHFRYGLLFVLCWMLSLVSHAQDTAVAAWGDTGLQVEYPDDWGVDTESDDALLVLWDDTISMFFYEPREARSPEDLLDDLMDENADFFEFGDIEETDLFGGEALRLDFTDGEITGFSLALEYDGQLLLVDSFVEDDRLSRSEEGAILDILATLQPLDSGEDEPRRQDEGIAEWGDTGLQVEVTDDWDVDTESEDAPLILWDGNIAIYFYEAVRADSVEEYLENLIDNNSDDFEFGEIEETDLFDGEALRVDFVSDVVAGFSIVVEYDGQILPIDAYVEDDRLSRSEEETILEVLSTLQPIDSANQRDTRSEPRGGTVRGGSSEGGNNESSTTGTGDALVLEDAFGDAEDAIAELEDLGLISDEGTLLFEEEMMGSALNSTEMPETYEGGNIVMAALISWRPVEGVDGEYFVCGLIAQSPTDDMDSTKGAMLIVGFDSDSAVAMVEFDLADVDNSIFDVAETEVNIHDPQHILMIVQDDTLMVFVNGELLVEDNTLEMTTGTDEFFAGYLLDPGCVMTGVWAYSFE
jgi:hypothetical protein